MAGPIYVVTGSTFMQLPEGTNLDKVAAEHGGDLIGHFPDAEVVDIKILEIRPATDEEIANLPKA